MSRYFALALAILAVAGSRPALAADPVPGGSCSTFTANSFQWSGGPENTGATNGMFCISNVWTNVINFKSGGNVGIGTTSPAAKLHVNGEAIISSTGLTCAAGTAGALRYQSAALELCDGTAWQNVNTPTTGYFVLTQTTYNGNLGNVSGANAKCLTELTTNTNWKGYAKANAQGLLDAAHVFAFLTSSTTANNLFAGTRYTFARVGSSSAGGAYFVTNGTGNGPMDNADWSGAGYFSGSYTFWTQRYTDSGTQWGSGTTYPACNDFTSTSTSYSPARAGISNNWANGRWESSYNGYGSDAACNATLPLVCFINP
jgi:hypothetical protein